MTLRRDFLKHSSVLATAAFVGTKRNSNATLEKFRTAHIGVGGMGGSDLNSIASHPNVEVAAICDVDTNTLNAVKKKFPNAATFTNYRDLIAASEKIDGIVVSTPDHTHAPAAMMALLANKPVYCQKPLTHEIFESRQLREVAAERKLITQMGIQIHSAAVYRNAVEIIRSGLIGKVSQVHAWSSKNWGYDGGEYAMGSDVPKNLEWDLWLDTAPERPYVSKVYHPGNWRKIVDFGTGTLGDMGVHIFDTPFTALKLTAPNWVTTTCRKPTNVGHPEKNIVTYEFPGTDYTTQTMTWKWYDGAYAPPKAEDVGLDAGTKLPGQGSLFVGEEGQLLLPHIAPAKLFPIAKFADAKLPEVGGNNHYHQWVDACAGETKTSADFNLAGPLTEALLLGVVANRFPDQKLRWDAESMMVTNLKEANQLIRREYRSGFEVEGLS